MQRNQLTFVDRERSGEERIAGFLSLARASVKPNRGRNPPNIDFNLLKICQLTIQNLKPKTRHFLSQSSLQRAGARFMRKILAKGADEIYCIAGERAARNAGI